MFKLVVFAILTAQFILQGQACEKAVFVDVKVRTSKYFFIYKKFDDINLNYTFTGCLNSDAPQNLKGASLISIHHEKVSALAERSVEGLTNLHELWLMSNEIETIKPGAFVNLPSLISLVLDHNKIQEIQRGVFNGQKVKLLSLSDNKISFVDSKAFDDMPNLFRLVLRNNALTTWNSEWFTNTPNIRDISVEYNRITELPERAFKNIKGMHFIYTKAADFILFTEIKLNNNEISKISSTAFKGLNDLDNLNLANNKLESIDENTFEDLKNIDSLVLSNNSLRCISDKIFSTDVRIITLELYENPIECECVNAMKQWAPNINVSITSKNDVLCN